MIVALEGTDGVGKTTLAHRLVELTDATYIHSGPPSSDSWFVEYVRPLLDCDGPMVLDRWHLGEIVWPLLWERKSLFSDLDEFKHCCEMLGNLGVLLAVVVRDEDGIIRTLAERGEEETIDDTLEAQCFYIRLADLASNHMPTAVLDSDELRGGSLWN